MKAHEAVEKDIPALVAFINKVWVQMKRSNWKAEVGSFDFLSEPSAHKRIAILKDKGEIVALIGARAINIDTGPGFNVYLAAVDQDRSDKVELLERLYLWSARLAISEGSTFFITMTPNEEHSLLRDTLGMIATDHGSDSLTNKVTELAFFEPLQAIISAILARHPDWK